jgi:hypothetical protein
MIRVARTDIVCEAVYSQTGDGGTMRGTEAFTYVVAFVLALSRLARE